MADLENLNQKELIEGAEAPVDTDFSATLNALEGDDEIKYDKDTMKDILIKKYDVKPPLHCDFDHQDEKGNYVFHIYESQETHNATVDWISINPYTGEATTFDGEIFNLADYKEDKVEYDKDMIKDILTKKYHIEPPYRCVLDHKDEGNYVFHIYESQETHNATVDWVTVNPHTGEATTFDGETFNLADHKDAYKEKGEKN